MSSPGAVIAGASVVMRNVHSDSLTSPERILVSLSVVVVVLIMSYIAIKFFDD